MRSRRKCPKGHEYWKSSDCPTCPRCEADKKPRAGFMAGLGAPAASGNACILDGGARDDKVETVHFVVCDAEMNLSAYLDWLRIKVHCGVPKLISE